MLSDPPSPYCWVIHSHIDADWSTSTVNSPVLSDCQNTNAYCLIWVCVFRDILLFIASTGINSKSLSQTSVKWKLHYNFFIHRVSRLVVTSVSFPVRGGVGGLPTVTLWLNILRKNIDTVCYVWCEECLYPNTSQWLFVKDANMLTWGKVSKTMTESSTQNLYTYLNCTPSFITLY